jgi:enamine deaminase RidA (YjgF/YER057c/UK114 family)
MKTTNSTVALALFAAAALGANGLAKGARVEVECFAFSPKARP